MKMVATVQTGGWNKCMVDWPRQEVTRRVGQECGSGAAMDSLDSNTN